MIVKTFWLGLLLLSSCGWRQRDFEKDLKNSTEANPEIDVSDKKLLEKFETKPLDEEKVAEAAPVTPVPEVKKETPATTETTKKTAPKQVKVTKTIVLKKVIAVKAKALPKDYPAELTALNAKAQKVWSQYKPNHEVGEKLFLNINYMGMTVGKIMAVNQGKKMINNKEVWHFHSRFKSAPFYSNIYELDDTVDTFVETDQFLSLKFSLVQRESKQDIDDLQLFDRDQMKLFWFYKRQKSDGEPKNKQGESYIPFFSVDPFSIMYFYQGLPLKDKDIYEIPVANKDKVMVMKSQVIGRETIDTEYGQIKAIRLQATTQYSGDQLKSGDMTFWFSDDDKRTLLRVQAKIKLGSVTAEIVKQ